MALTETDRTNTGRPSPESFMAAARDESRHDKARGRLKIFLGASPGVGKTFAMLEEAKLRQKAGVDVVAGLIETHGRAETEALLDGIEVLPRVMFDHRGQSVGEMDVDALIARRPGLALIDEFAHTNTSGSRHPKRWQDVMEVLDAGIDVVTTLNIQHIESLNDAVAQITGVRVQETVPDEVLQRADQIELIDLPPDELITRLKDGKIYGMQQAGRALENFFTKGKLTALREMALRAVAGQVDAEMLAIKQANAVEGIWPTDERLLVCINEAPAAKVLVRTAKRMAERAKIPWIAVTVITPRHEAMNPETRATTNDALRLAESLGGEVVILRAESNATRELLRFARERNVSRLLIGRPRWRNSIIQWLMAFVREPVSEKLLDAATDFEVTVVTPHARVERRKAQTAPRQKQSWRPYAFSAGFVGAATLVAWPVAAFDAIPEGGITVLYLLAVLISGARFGLWPSLLASVLGFAAYNFLYTEPYFTFSVAKPSDVVSLSFYLLGAIFTGTLASRLKAQVEAMRASQMRTETLYAFARKIASATKADDVLWAAVSHIAKALDCHAIILTPDNFGILQQVQGYPSIEEELDARAEGAAKWAFDKSEPAGIGTGTLPNGAWLFVPLATAGRPFGVIGVKFRDSARFSDPEIRRLLLAVEDQVAVAVERNRFSDDLANARINQESDKLRAALLNAVSHDLRTPLVGIIGATSALAENHVNLSKDLQQDLAQTALSEARRLDRTVQNLLDMTRLGYGALTPNRSIFDLREIVGQVRSELVRVLCRHPFAVDTPRDLPLLNADPVLLGHALTNLFENAAKYAPTGTTITISARAEAENVNIMVSDQGPGIPPQERALVFDLFHRVAKGDGAPAGTGMGLAIVKGLIEAHGGTVKADVGPDGRGTTIVMALPAASSSDARQ